MAHLQAAPASQPSPPPRRVAAAGTARSVDWQRSADHDDMRAHRLPLPVLEAAARCHMHTRTTPHGLLHLRSTGPSHGAAAAAAAVQRGRGGCCRISFLAEPLQLGGGRGGDEDARSDGDRRFREQYARLFLDALATSSSKRSPALTLVETEADVLDLFHRINAQLRVPPDTLPPQRAWALAIAALLGSSSTATDERTPTIERIKAQLRPSGSGIKDAFAYDPGMVYEARCLYDTYLRYARRARTEQVLLPAERSAGPTPAIVLPLLRAYVHSFVPDPARAFGLYADLLASSGLSHAGADTGGEDAAEVYAVLIGLCVRQGLMRRALRLVRDMTVLGDHLAQDERATSRSTPRSAPLRALALTRWERVELLTLLMRSATSHAEAYAIYWRLRRMWAGFQAYTFAQRLRGLAPDGHDLRSSGLLEWMRRVARRSHGFHYLGQGIDADGALDTGREALEYWRAGLPASSASSGDHDASAAAGGGGRTLEHESVHLTEDELMNDDAHAHTDAFRSSRFSLGSILSRLQAARRGRPAESAAAQTIYASAEERQAQLNASPFSPGGWMHLLSVFPDLPCGWVHVPATAHKGGGGTSNTTSKGKRTASGELQQVWIPAPPELVISLFWDMLQAGVSPPPQVYTNLLHYYTRLVKAARQTSGLDVAHNDGEEEDDGDDDEARTLQFIQTRQRHLLASDAVAALHKLIYLDIHLAPDLPLINALMNAYGHLGRIEEVLEIWQTLVNLSGGGRTSLSHEEVSLTNRMDAQSVAIVLDACGFAGTAAALARARKVVGWARHRDRVAESLALGGAERATAGEDSRGQTSGGRRTPPTSDRGPTAAAKPPAPAFLMSKGAWDAWLECLCRRGHVREAVRVLEEEMVPVLRAQRTRFAFRDRAAAEARSSGGGHGHAPDAKTLGMLLRFAARDRARRGAGTAAAADSVGLDGSSSRVRRAPAHTSALEPAHNASPAGIGGSLLGGGGGGGDEHAGRLPASPSTSAGASALAASGAGGGGGEVWTSLRAWIRREMPEEWAVVQQVGAGRTGVERRRGSRSK